MRLTTNGAVAAIIFVVASFGLLWLHGNRLVFSSDEGIILDAANRMLHGESLYRDFFGYMSPGSYWLQLAIFHFFGVSQWAGRIVVIFDFALQCALVFWLTSRLAGRNAGLAAAALFFSFQVPAAEFLLAQHRMDSSALSLASISFCLAGQQRGRSWCWVLAGFLMASASACTPSIALLAPVTLGWLGIDGERRRFLVPYASGLCTGVLAVVAALVASGSLVHFVNQMRWLQHNYSVVNIMPYGSIIGGYGSVLGTAKGLTFVIRALAIFCRALPAVLPIVALATWIPCWSLHRDARCWATKRAIPYLLVSMLVSVGSTFPRADVAHLAFVAALPAVLTAVWFACYAPRPVVACLLGFLGLWAGVFLAEAASRLSEEIPVVTPIGTLQAQPSDVAAVNGLLQSVRPHDALYVHPYNPMLYFLSQGRNPTRYSYLAPGMMTHNEELAALTDLQKSPPRWLLYLPLSRAEFLRVYPHGGNLNHRFPLIDAWVSRDYILAVPAVSVAGYQLYKHR